MESQYNLTFLTGQTWLESLFKFFFYFKKNIYIYPTILVG